MVFLLSLCFPGGLEVEEMRDHEVFDELDEFFGGEAFREEGHFCFSFQLLFLVLTLLYTTV